MSDKIDDLLETYAGLLLELGREGNNPTETELVLWCRDAARVASEAVRRLRSLDRELSAAKAKADALECDVQILLDELTEARALSQARGAAETKDVS